MLLTSLSVHPSRMYTVCLHYSMSYLSSTTLIHSATSSSKQEKSSSGLIIHMATSSTSTTTSSTSSSTSSGYMSNTTTTPPEHPSSPELFSSSSGGSSYHLPTGMISNSSTPSSTLKRLPSPLPPSSSPVPSTSRSEIHHPNFANHVSNKHRLHLHRTHHQHSYSSSTGSSSDITTENPYQREVSIDSQSPPPYTDTMDSRTASAIGAAVARRRLDSSGSTEDNVQEDDHQQQHTSTAEVIVQQERPSSSRDFHNKNGSDVHDNALADVSSNSTYQIQSNNQQQTEAQKKLGHRRVDENGEVTYKHIQSTQIMFSIQLGIGHSVGSLASKPERDVLYNDFNTVEMVHFPVRGSTTTPAHHYSDFDFTTYTPNAFRHFRDLFRIQPEDYMLSMTAVPLRELSNPGASGSVFYITQDDLFIVKTVEKNESKFLLKLLPGYYMNLSQNPHTLLPKFFGLYTYECSGKNIRILVMNNLLPSDVRLHEKYDLKGSTYKRKASESERNKKSPTFKDLDFLERYHLLERYSRSTVTLHRRTREEESLGAGLGTGTLNSYQLSTLTLPVTNGTVNGIEHEETSFGGLQLEAPVYDELMNTLQRDCRVLESFEIMDYSLLVGVHNYDRQLKEDQKAGGDRVHFDYDDDDSLPPGAIRASNHKGERLLLFVGIIDILQSYRLFKKVEHAWKALLHDGDTVSVHRPKFYARRFLTFMQKYVFSRVAPPGSSKNDDKYSLYYQVARQRKDSAWNSSAGGTLQRSISQHPTSYAASSYGSHFR